jgi:hypothetical protein
MAPGKARRPVAELYVLLAGVVVAILANFLSIDWLFIVGVFVALVSLMAAIITLPASHASSKNQLILLGVGVVVVVVGIIFSVVMTGDDPVVFAPALLMYPGGALIVSSALTLLLRQRQSAQG